MNAFGAFVQKEFFHIARDKRTLFVLIGMPIIQLIIFGYAIRTEINNAAIGLLDFSKDDETQRIVAKVTGSGYFRLAGYYTSYGEIQDDMRAGKIKSAIVFEPNFERNLRSVGKANVQILSDASDPNHAALLNAYISSVIADYSASMVRQAGADISLPTIEVKMLYNPEMKSVFMFVPGLITLLLMLISALMTSIAITREKETGTLEALLVSPLKPTMIIFGKVMPYIALALINAATVTAVALALFKTPFRGSFALFFLEALLFIIVALSLGILISTIAKTQQTALMMALGGLLMPTVLLSGYIFPVENMPAWLQIIAHILPPMWFLRIIRAIMLKGSGLADLLMETGALVLMAVVILTVSLKKFKVRLE
ncbi:MAG: ABC transporter permease [Chloroflexota bacterium]